MSGDHNQYQKNKSYLDDMDRYKQVRELVKGPSLRIKDIAELTGYNKGHVSRLRKASQQFECPRCGHCCQADQPAQQQEPVAWMYINKDGECEQIEYGPVLDDPDVTPLYTAPPKKQWVGMTDEERHNIREWQEIQKELGPVWAPMMLYLYLAIEQALKEKNHG